MPFRNQITFIINPCLFPVLPCDKLRCKNITLCNLLSNLCFFSFSFRMITRLSTVVLANRLTDLVTMRLILPSKVSAIISLKPSRRLVSLFDGSMTYGVIGVANLVLISIIFSLLTIRFKSIWVACGLHSFWNAILYCILGLNLSGNDETVTAIFNMKSVGNNIWNGGAYGIEASLITTVVLAFAATLIWYMNRKRVNVK